MKYIIFMTPRAASKFDPSVIPEWSKDFEIEATAQVYMNMLGGWTEEECDAVYYIVEKDSFNTNKLKFNVKI